MTDRERERVLRLYEKHRDNPIVKGIIQPRRPTQQAERKAVARQRRGASHSKGMASSFAGLFRLPKRRRGECAGKASMRQRIEKKLRGLGPKRKRKRKRKRTKTKQFGSRKRQFGSAVNQSETVASSRVVPTGEAGAGWSSGEEHGREERKKVKILLWNANIVILRIWALVICGYTTVRQRLETHTKC